MSPPGRPKGELRSAQHEGTPVSALHGRPKTGSLPPWGKARSAQGATVSVTTTSPCHGRAERRANIRSADRQTQPFDERLP